ncbi:SOS response-associated peptidase [Salipiger sp.]|uniref:SOS response-associated peptidase n=1 Tax=Salipiger sp. TaxID=2078585 RepID=UPI003A986532
MCGRFVDPNLRSIGLDTSWLKIDPFAGWTRRYNVKPTQDAVILTPDLVPMVARWWLVPSWHRGDLGDWKATTFNARFEDAKDKPSFRAVWRRGRCLIPVGGFYEWTGEKGAKRPHFITSAGNAETLFLAGLASRWQELLTCTILTRAANADMQPLHTRMPVILDPEEQDAWLSGSDDPDLGAGARLRHHPVEKFAIADDGPELIEPAE